MASTAVWLLDSRRVDDHALEAGKRLLSPSEKERLTRFLRPERQRQYVLGHALLRVALAEASGMAPAEFDVADRHGLPPLLIVSSDRQAPCFSLSHSGHWIACAVSNDTALGIDIETLDVRRDVMALSESAFSSAEHALIAGLSGSERAATFYRIWTMKEALFKLSSSPEQPTPAPSSVATLEGALLFQGENWFASALEHAELSISICSTHLLTNITCIAPPTLTV